MISKLTDDTLIVRGFIGEDIVDTITKACKKHNVRAGYVSGIGATDDVTIGVYDVKTKVYNKKNYKGAYEILNLTGNISTMEGELYTHLHITIAGEDNKAIGGHLNNGNISVTLEVFIKVIDTTIERKIDQSIGINMMNF